MRVRTLMVAAATATLACAPLAGCAAGGGTTASGHGGGSPRTQEGHTHEHSLREVPDGQTAPSVRLEVSQDSMSGWNVHVITEDYELTPENAGSKPRAGEGHAHLYVDGKKVHRVYGHWFHLPADAVPRGSHVLSVTLNANDHSVWAEDGKPIKDAVRISSTGAAGDGDGQQAGPARPDVTLKIAVHGGSVSPATHRETVRQGQRVRLTVTSDRANKVHVHGYNLESKVRPGRPAVITFIASKPGLFEVETHDPARQLLQLAVE